ncbi:MAG: twin-arginine translocation signal domain-containing protein [Campylobacteraceae bacterium]|nr:twin-arginine translocation signal domain-containing protein [Campylobacteraceae bacterium]
MSNSRRNFVKKALGAGAVLAAASTVSMANSGNKNFSSSGGVVVGKSKKKEILYKETKEWEDFYKRSY